MNAYWLAIAATIGIAMTLIALTGLCLVAGLRWALVDGRWSRARADLVMGGLGLGTWVVRGASMVRLLLARGERPPGTRT
jgi:hypothetical protein